MFLYAITDSRQLASDFKGRCSALVQLAEQWVSGGVDAIQLREKDLEAGALESLTSKVLRVVEGSLTRVFVNGRVDVAVATGAEVHLPAGSLLPSQVTRIYAGAGMPWPEISVACHSVADVRRTAADGGTLALLAPVFGKRITGHRANVAGLGLDALRLACLSDAAGASPVPVLALGGVTARNAWRCVEAGAAGVAGIRLFSGDDWRELNLL